MDMDANAILALPMRGNDAGAETVREYLKALLRELWREGEGFSGKRPFGNSGWECDLYEPLIQAGAIGGAFDDDGNIEHVDETAARAAIAAAIEAL
jgi:hypothetical protein